MTPKEKAEELIDKYIQFLPYYSKSNNLKRAVGSALIAVDEIMQSLSVIPYGMQYLSAIDYWIEVRHEIEKVEL